jgi:hypothetical protein
MPNSISGPNPGRLSPRAIVLIALVLGTLAKLWLAGTSIGSNDLPLFRGFARLIEQRGLIELYQGSTIFNHTPMVSAYTVGVGRISGDDAQTFAFFFRLGGIIADAAVVLGLLRMVRLGAPIPTWALALFAASPVSIMVSGFHGNVDPLLAAGLFFAAMLLREKRWLAAGLALAFACNIKVSALLMAPAFGAWALAADRKGAAKFVGTAALVTLAGWSWPLLACPGAFTKNVLGYGGYWGIWGITQVLRATGNPDFAKISYVGLSAAQTTVISTLKLVIIGSALGLAWLWRKRDIFPTVAATWLIFLVFAPGVAAQYLVWPASFLLLWSPRGYAAVTAGCAVFLAAFYTVICNGWPWVLGVSTSANTPNWLPWTYAAWLPCVAWLILWPFIRSRAACNVDLERLPKGVSV